MKLFHIFYVLFSVFFCVSSFGQTDSIAPKQAPSDSSQIIADNIVKSKIPVFIDFWAKWCGPCRLLNPTIAKLEKKYEGKVKFMKVNVDLHRGISQYFGISSIPAVFIINNRTVQKGFLGLQPEEVYSSALDSVLVAAKNQPKSPSPPPAQQQ